MARVLWVFVTGVAVAALVMSTFPGSPRASIALIAYLILTAYAAIGKDE